MLITQRVSAYGGGGARRRNLSLPSHLKVFCVFFGRAPLVLTKCSSSLHIMNCPRLHAQTHTIAWCFSDGPLSRSYNIPLSCHSERISDSLLSAFSFPSILKAEPSNPDGWTGHPRMHKIQDELLFRHASQTIPRAGASSLVAAHAFWPLLK